MFDVRMTINAHARRDFRPWRWIIPHKRPSVSQSTLTQRPRCGQVSRPAEKTVVFSDNGCETAYRKVTSARPVLGTPHQNAARKVESPTPGAHSSALALAPGYGARLSARSPTVPYCAADAPLPPGAVICRSAETYCQSGNS